MNLANWRGRRFLSVFASALVALAVALGAAPAQATFAVPPNKPGQYAPRDECSARPGGAEFLAKLKDAVKARNAVSLALLSSPEIVLDLGGGQGRDELQRRLLPQSDLWAELDRILTLGCAWDEDNQALVLPWFFNQDLGDSDPYGTSVTLGKLPLHKDQAPNSSVRATLDWQLVFIGESKDIGSPLVPVSVIDSDLEGFAELEKLRSQLDYRIRAGQKDGKWLITAFVAGE